MTGPSPERWATIKALFHTALPLDPPDRATFLATACDGDDALRHEVESLLSSHGEAGDFLDVGAPLLGGGEPRAEPVRLPRIGPYRILEEIGRGGMGTVYLGVRDDGEFSRRVAIKVISAGMDTEAVAHRFWHERQILADLDHPNIARLIDGGATEEGRPYFVMELVEGTPVHHHCDERELEIEEILELFVTICAAVEHAHHHLVVHRDLKPGNILVTSDGAPKLLDFGIAKVLEPGLPPEATIATLAAFQAMTPQYASPEQVRGGAITTASDVYALGALLYRLLTGRSAYPVEGLSPIEVARLVCEHEPARPSAVVTEPRLRRRLRGDLDTIVLKALQKEPARRYDAVRQLADDLRRHLDGRPVLARPDRVYRTRRFARRYRVAVGAAALLLVSLLGGIVATTWQMSVARAERARAERRFEDVRGLARKLVFEYNDAIYDLPGSTPVRQRLVGDAIVYLESLAREAGDDPQLRREVGEGYYKIGEVQARMGDLRGSLESHLRSRDILAGVAAAESRNVSLLQSVAASHQMVADRLTDTGDATGALDEHLRALEIRRRVQALEPGGIRPALDLIHSHLFVGRARLSLGEYDDALVSLERAVTIGDSLLSIHPLDLEVQFDAMTAWYTLATGQLARHDLETSAENYGRALELTRALGASDSVHSGYRQALSRTHVRIGRIRLLQERPTEALRAFEEALAVSSRLASEDPSNAETGLDLATIHGARGEALLALGRFREAADCFRESLQRAERVVRIDPAHVRARRVMASTLRGTGELSLRLGETDEAIAAFERGLLVFRRLLDADPANVELRHDVATLHRRVGYAHQQAATDGTSDTGHRDAACEAWRRADREWEALRREGLLNPGARHDQAGTDPPGMDCHTPRVAGRPS